MAVTVTATPLPEPGAVLIQITGGTANAEVFVWREIIGQSRQRVRGADRLDASGGLVVNDYEAPIDRAWRYVVEDVASHQNVTYLDVAALPHEGKVLIRNVERPTLSWAWVSVYDETSLERAVRADTFVVIGRPDPITVTDVLRYESGVLEFLAPTLADADRIIDVLQPGAPIVYRTPCAEKTRDKVFTVTGGVRDTLIRKDRQWRLVEVPFQRVAWPDERPGVADVLPTWDYAALTTVAAARGIKYNGLQPLRRTYDVLAIDPIR
jgi:hypothetical protein